jgi:hypothetical protein
LPNSLGGAGSEGVGLAKPPSANKARANKTGANETKANETKANETKSNEASAAPQATAIGSAFPAIRFDDDMCIRRNDCDISLSYCNT